jgi:hypothetical protein
MSKNNVRITSGASVKKHGMEVYVGLDSWSGNELSISMSSNSGMCLMAHTMWLTKAQARKLGKHLIKLANR